MKYKYELGQALFGNPTGEFSCPEYVEALCFYILKEAHRVYSNNTQDFSSNDEDYKRIGGVIIRPYCWDEDSPDCALANLEFNGVEIRWYKHCGRGMSVNKNWSESKWVNWFNMVINELNRNDSARLKELGAKEK